MLSIFVNEARWVLMSLRTGFYIGSYLEMRPVKICINYAKTWMLVDLVVVVTEWSTKFAESSNPASILRSSRVTKVRCYERY